MTAKMAGCCNKEVCARRACACAVLAVSCSCRRNGDRDATRGTAAVPQCSRTQLYASLEHTPQQETIPRTHLIFYSSSRKSHGLANVGAEARATMMPNFIAEATAGGRAAAASCARARPAARRGRRRVRAAAEAGQRHRLCRAEWRNERGECLRGAARSGAAIQRGSAPTPTACAAAARCGRPAPTCRTGRPG